jgi:predicted transcriptional regulator
MQIIRQFGKKEKSIPERAIEIIRNRGNATSKEVFELIERDYDTTLNTVRNALYRLNKEEKINETGEFRDRYKVYQVSEELKEDVEDFEKKILKAQKEENIEDIKFLMDFFQENKDILIKENKKFFNEHRERFIDIAKKIERFELENE